MSIANSFRPARDRGPSYVQPVMTGYNTWSNNPSFGLSVKANRDNYGAAWHALDGDGSTKWGTNTVTEAMLTITFDRKLLLHGVRFFGSYRGTVYRYVRLQVDGSEVFYEENVPYSPYTEINLEPVQCTELKLGILPTYFNGGIGGVYLMDIIATYKP